MEQQMDPEMQKILRAPFPPEQVGKLPKITCRDCTSSRTKVCDRHQKAQCNVCRNWITGAHLHVDYVGHAAITDRLLKADPDWSWAPAYRNVDPHIMASAVASGNPEVVAQVIANSPPLETAEGMWIVLTVGGVTRLGYGSDDRGGMDHDKVLIGDALRNAAMRFGVGLDLWSKEDLGSDDTTPGQGDESGRVRQLQALPEPAGRDWQQEAAQCTDLDSLLRLGVECTDAGEFTGPNKATLLRRRRELGCATASPQQLSLNGS